MVNYHLDISNLTDDGVVKNMVIVDIRNRNSELLPYLEESERDQYELKPFKVSPLLHLITTSPKNSSYSQ